MRRALLLAVLTAACHRPAPPKKQVEAPPPPPALHVTDGKRAWDAPAPLLEKVGGRLRDVGVYRGAVDGRYHPELQQALKQFQAARGLPATGILDAPTADALGVSLDAKTPTLPPVQQPPPLGQVPIPPPAPLRPDELEGVRGEIPASQPASMPSTDGPKPGI